MDELENVSYRKTYEFDGKLDEETFATGSPVFLNVYHKWKFSYYSEFMGLGVYHSGIEASDFEFSYGFCNNSLSGIIITKPEVSQESMVLKEKIYLGHTYMSLDNLKEIVEYIEEYWIGESYDPFNKSCHTFCKYFSSKIVIGSCNYPMYVTLIGSHAYILYSFYKPFVKLVNFNLSYHNSISNSSIEVRTSLKKKISKP